MPAVVIVTYTGNAGCCRCDAPATRVTIDREFIPRNTYCKRHADERVS